MHPALWVKNNSEGFNNKRKSKAKRSTGSNVEFQCLSVEMSPRLQQKMYSGDLQSGLVLVLNCQTNRKRLANRTWNPEAQPFENLTKWPPSCIYHLKSVQFSPSFKQSGFQMVRTLIIVLCCCKLIIQDLFAYLQVVTNCQYSIAQMCTWEEFLPTGMIANLLMWPHESNWAHNTMSIAKAQPF